MDNNRIRIFLGVNYSTVPGENVFVVGSIPELGNWDPLKGFPLNYHEGANWSNALEICQKAIHVEYKYVVLNSKTNEVRWEEGENRILNLKGLKPSKSELFNIESWNHREVNIRIKYDCSSKKILAICGEGIALGNWKNPMRMVLVYKKDPVTGNKITFWEKKFFVRHDVKRIKYRFVLLDDEEDTITWEREPDRVCDLVHLTTLSPYKRFEFHPNKKDCMKFKRKSNRFVKHDCNFVSELCYNVITSNITIGPYPQNRNDIEILANLGIKAVLNLQTRSDMKHRSVDWDELRRNYKDNKIKVVNFSIIDMSADDIKFKAYDGANILHNLVKKYEKVYVHCTAGIWRAPHVTAAYLHYYQEQALEEVVRLIKEKRPFVYLSKDLLQRAYNLYEKRLKTVGLYFNNTDTARIDAEVITDENIAKNRIMGAVDDAKEFQFGNTLMEVRCSSGRNL